MGLVAGPTTWGWSTEGEDGPDKRNLGDEEVQLSWELAGCLQPVTKSVLESQQWKLKAMRDRGKELQCLSHLALA